MADQLDVDADDVTITSVTVNEEGTVVITYVVEGVDTTDLGDAEVTHPFNTSYQYTLLIHLITTPSVHPINIPMYH